MIFREKKAPQDSTEGVLAASGGRP